MDGLLSLLQGFPLHQLLAGNMPLWQPCRWKVAAISHALGPANICYKPVLQIRFTSFHHSPVGAAQLCGHELAYPQYTSQSSQSQNKNNKTRLYFIQSFSQFSSIFTGIAAETLVSGFKPPTQPSFCEKLHQRHDHAAMHTVNKKLHVCKRKKKSGSALQRLLSWFYTRYVLCTRFLWGIVILTNLILNAVSIHYVANDHALQEFGRGWSLAMVNCFKNYRIM